MNIFGLQVSPLYLAISVVLGLGLLYVARPWARRFLWAVFFGLSYGVGRVAHILIRSSQKIHAQYARDVASYAAQQLERRMGALGTKLERSIPHFSTQISEHARKVQQTTENLNDAVDVLFDANPSDQAASKVKLALANVGVTSNTEVTAAMRVFRRDFAQEVSALNGELKQVRLAAPALAESAKRLGEVQGEITRASEQANEAFGKFSAVLETDNRRKLASEQSILFPWIASLVLVLIAFAGVTLNFFLIQRPMGEIVGTGVQIVGVDLPVAMAVAVILLEMTAGLFFFEAAGITHMVDKVETASERTRKIMMWTAFGFLVTFSFFEAALALGREALILQQNAMEARASGGVAGATTPSLSLTTVAQVLLGAMMPWLLALATIPLETVLRSGMLIIMLACHLVIGLVGNAIQLAARAVRGLGVLALHAYDLVIFLPLAIEALFRRRDKEEEAQPEARTQRPAARERPSRPQIAPVPLVNSGLDHSAPAQLVNGHDHVMPAQRGVS